MTRMVWNPREEERLLRSARGPVAGHLRGEAKVVRAAAQHLCPVSPDGSHGNPPGHLRDSITATVGVDAEGLYADVGTDVEYGIYVELGTRPHIIESHGDYPLRDEHGRVFGKTVHHPGTQAQPFLRPAIEFIRD